MSESKILKFPKNFLWGVSTSAYQVEGGIINDWSEWEKSEARVKDLKFRGKNPEDYISARACDSCNRYEEDFDLAKELNCSAFRLGIEWAKLETAPGQWDKVATEHYRQVLLAAKKRNLKIVLTLWHWTNPMWLAESGGWAKRNTVKHFARYVEYAVNELGDLVDYWVTINEPMVYLANGFLTGIWPPNKRNMFKMCRAYENLIKAHKISYEVIHKKYKDAKVGLTMLANYFEPARIWHPLELIMAKLANYFWNNRFVKRLGGRYDFLGLDYYFHDRIIWYPPFKKNLNKKVTDMGWEIYPQGIYQVLKNYSKFEVPLFIMENGIADVADAQRARFIIDHLNYVYQAIQDGIDVRGYFYWSLLDNFEWAHGFTQKFGLYALDRLTQKRTARPSAKVYAEICKNNQLSVN
jgi:beta-glucosidase